MRQSVSNKATPSITPFSSCFIFNSLNANKRRNSRNCLSHLEAGVRKSNQNWMAEMKWNNLFRGRGRVESWMKGCEISSNLFRWRVFWLVVTKYRSPNHIFLLLFHLSAIFSSQQGGKHFETRGGQFHPYPTKKDYIPFPSFSLFFFFLINPETIKIDQSRRCENIMPMTYHESTAPRI